MRPFDLAWGCVVDCTAVPILMGWCSPVFSAAEIGETMTTYAPAFVRGNDRFGGRRPKLSPDQIVVAQNLYDAGEKTVQQIANILKVPRTAVYGHLNKNRTEAASVQ